MNVRVQTAAVLHCEGSVLCGSVNSWIGHVLTWMQVRTSFGTKLRCEVHSLMTKHSAAAVTPGVAAQLGKLTAIMCFAACDPLASSRDPMLTELVATLASWRKHVADAAACSVATSRHRGQAHTSDLGAAEQASSELALQPHYGVFYLMALLAEHDDCPDIIELQALTANTADPRSSQHETETGDEVCACAAATRVLHLDVRSVAVPFRTRAACQSCSPSHVPAGPYLEQYKCQVQAMATLQSLDAICTMLTAHLTALFATTPKAQLPEILSHVRAFAQVARQLLPAAPETPDQVNGPQRLTLVADLTVAIAQKVAGPFAHQASRQLPKLTRALPDLCAIHGAM